MATIIFFVGAGVTIVDFCCINCVENTIFMNNHNMSCDMQDNKAEDYTCCSNDSDAAIASKYVNKNVSQHEDKCCQAERISIDIDNRIYKSDLNSTFIYSFLYYFCSNFINSANNSENHFSDAIESDSVPIPPRDYLSLIRVLII